MITLLRPAFALVLLMTLITGILYPLAVTGIAQMAFPDQANGSLTYDALGKPNGSTLIAQGFTDAKWFQPRPSAGDYATVASGASNLAPSNPALAERVKDAADALYVDGQGPVPLALLTTSGSGLDPQLSPAAADYQVARVAGARHLEAQQVQALIAQHTDTSLFGPPVVNVLALNLALQAMPSQP